jgi:triphosphoribosyl-dephospho-CoA synthase
MLTVTNLIADLAVTALRAEADLTPKPGLVDGRGSGAHVDMTRQILHDSADALRDSFAECALAAERFELGAELRAHIGVIGRTGERRMLAATRGVNTHRGALWALGLLSAGAASTGGTEAAVAFAAALARIPDPVSTARISHGQNARRRYGAPGATGEAQAGFPHVTTYALPALRHARNCGADEPTARLDALLALVARLDDTCILHRGGRRGLRAVQSGAAAVLRAGGSGTLTGRTLFASLDRLCAERRLSPGGSADLLSATLFLDALEERNSASCKP